jgi:FMN-dependent NADH-azoreductase
MRPLLLVEASPRFGRSLSRAAGEHVVQRLKLKMRQPELTVLRRDLVAEAPPFVDEAFTEAMYVPTAQQDEMQRKAMAASETMIAELEESGALVISTPMHNFTVPAVLKAWIDQVLRFDRTFRRTAQGKVGLLADRPTHVVVATGGFIRGERARQPDFLTPYLEAVLATLGIRTVRFLYLEPLPGVSPQSMDDRIRHWLDQHLPVDKQALQFAPSGQ